MMKPPWRSSQGTAARVIETTERALRSITARHALVVGLERGNSAEHQTGIVDKPVETAEMRPPSRRRSRSHSPGSADVALDCKRFAAAGLDLALDRERGRLARMIADRDPGPLLGESPAPRAAPMPVEPPVTRTALPARSGMTIRAEVTANFRLYGRGNHGCGDAARQMVRGDACVPADSGLFRPPPYILTGTRSLA